MRAKKIVLMPLMIMLALGISGVAFAYWSDYVRIEGTVNMGSLTLAFDYEEPPICTEMYRDPIDNKLKVGEYLGKDVGDQKCWYDEESLIVDPHTKKKGYKTMGIEITNAYPQYIVHCIFKLHNIGTIPLDVVAYEITGEKRDKEGTVIYKLLWYDPDGDYIGSLWEDVNGNGRVDIGGPDLEVINLEITNSLPYQIDPCKTNKAEIDMDFKQDAEECHTYTIHVTVVGVQWNKTREFLD